jgi:GT2 family glycosyltransferase
VTQLSVVIPTRSQRALLVECLQSLEPARRRLGEPSEIVVVDDGSEDDTAEVVRSQFPEVVLIENASNQGFPAAVNEGIRRAGGDWVLLLNTDTTVHDEALVQLLDCAGKADDIGSVAAQMRFADAPEMINSAGIEVDRLGIASDRLLARSVKEGEPHPVEVFGACGGAALYRRLMLDELGGFDESFHAYLEDVDLAWRAQMGGWRCLYAPGAVIYHHHSAFWRDGSPRKYYLSGRNRIRLLAKNADRRQLTRYGLQMLAYDIVHVVAVMVRRRSLAALRGRMDGLRDWRHYRRLATERRPLDLPPNHGLRFAWRRFRRLSARG